jgi:formiminotetrahydrofolate cyclodeaminase
VANLTVGKKGYEQAWDELAAIAERGQTLKDTLARAVDEDTDAFNCVMEAMRLPKGTADQQAERARAIEEANKAAAEVPLQTARLCLEAIGLAAKAAELGNRNSASDAGVAALAARAGVEGAALNVRTNLGGIADAEYKTRAAAEAAALETGARRACDAVQARVAALITS